jgi:hypothetical protein
MAAAINISLVGLFAKLLDRLKKHAPAGYQDESGFHLGAQKN